MSEPLARVFAAEAAAEQELAAIPDWLWDGRSPPVPVETIADSHYGLLVRESEDLGELAGLSANGKISGLFYPYQREIWVDTEESERAPVRRRFTIGHELGHWVLHCHGKLPQLADEEVIHCRSEVVREQAAAEPQEQPASARPRWSPLGLSYYPPPELDANQFGAALLMPRRLLETEHAWADEETWRVARTFGVSEMALQKRLWFLRKFPPPPSS